KETNHIVRKSFELRAERAAFLAPSSKAAEAPLRFAADLYLAQANLADDIEQSHQRARLSGNLEQDVDRISDACRAFLGFAARKGPQALAELARARQDEDPQTMHGRLLVYWSGDRDARADFLTRSVLRPYVEVLAHLKISPDRMHRQGHCPFCGGAPWIGIRRAISEADRPP